MTVYNQHTVTSVFVGPTGHQHDRQSGAKDEEPTAIDCDACSAALAAEGWVFDPSLVPETDRQIAQKDQREREGNAAVQQAAAALAEMSNRVVQQSVKDRAKEAKKADKPKGKPGPKPHAKVAQPSEPVPENPIAISPTEPDPSPATTEPVQDDPPGGEESSELQ